MKMKPLWVNCGPKDDVRVVIVGQWPGNPRKGLNVDTVFTGNRTGDFVRGIVVEYPGVVLTNAHNWLRPRVDPQAARYLTHGLPELVGLLQATRPEAVIALGTIAQEQTTRALLHLPSLAPTCQVYKVRHPSFVLRFNLDPASYVDQLDEVLAFHTNRELPAPGQGSEVSNHE